VTKKNQGQRLPQDKKKTEDKVVKIGLLTPFLSGKFSLMTPSQKKQQKTLKKYENWD
jgi:hypothetical protein